MRNGRGEADLRESSVEIMKDRASSMERAPSERHICGAGEALGGVRSEPTTRNLSGIPSLQPRVKPRVPPWVRPGESKHEDRYYGVGYICYRVWVHLL